MKDYMMAKIDLPEDVSRKTHFLTVRNVVVDGKTVPGKVEAVAILKTAEMKKKGAETRTRKAAVKHERDEKRQEKEIMKQRKAEIRAEMKELKKEQAKAMEEIKKKRETMKLSYESAKRRLNPPKKTSKKAVAAKPAENKPADPATKE